MGDGDHTVPAEIPAATGDVIVMALVLIVPRLRGYVRGDVIAAEDEERMRTRYPWAVEERETTTAVADNKGGDE
jgi:hypothetical protein